jgi:hypothetical protein
MRTRVDVRTARKAVAALAVGLGLIGLIGLIAALSLRAPSVTGTRAATAIEYGVSSTR